MGIGITDDGKVHLPAKAEISLDIFYSVDPIGPVQERGVVDFYGDVISLTGQEDLFIVEGISGIIGMAQDGDLGMAVQGVDNGFGIFFLAGPVEGTDDIIGHL